MAKQKTSKAVNAPLTFDLSLELLKRLQAFQKASEAQSISQVVRHALEAYDLRSFKSQKDEHKQVSVRLPDALRKKLVSTAKSRKESIGEVIRAALVDLPEKPQKSLAAPVTKTPSKKTSKPAKKKTSTKAKTKQASAKKTPVKKAPVKKAKKAEPKLKKPARKVAKQVETDAKPLARKVARKVARKPSR